MTLPTTRLNRSGLGAPSTISFGQRLRRIQDREAAGGARLLDVDVHREQALGEQLTVSLRCDDDCGLAGEQPFRQVPHHPVGEVVVAVIEVHRVATRADRPGRQCLWLDGHLGHRLKMPTTSIVIYDDVRYAERRYSFIQEVRRCV
jgi:hypothetical protein